MTSSTDHYEEKSRCAAYYEVIAPVQALPPPNHCQHYDTALLCSLLLILLLLLCFLPLPTKFLSGSRLRRARLISNWLEHYIQTLQFERRLVPTASFPLGIVH
jgi:hypothetical protein